MKKKVIIIISIIVVILVALGIYFGIKSINLKKYREADVYNVNGEEITSVKTVLGDKELKSYSYEKGSAEILTLTFEDSNAKESAIEYIEYIYDNGNYIRMQEEESNKQEIAKSAENSDNLLTVSVTYTESEFTVEIYVGTGSIKINSEE